MLRWIVLAIALRRDSFRSECGEATCGQLSSLTTDVHSTAGIETELGIAREEVSKQGRRKKRVSRRNEEYATR